MMNDEEKTLAGKIGLGLSIFLWMICSWRLSFHSWDSCCCSGRYSNRRGRRRERINPVVATGVAESPQQWQSRDDQYWYTFYATWFTRRRTFHGLLWLATLCEMAAYADLSGIFRFTTDRALAINLGYILLNVAGRSILESLAFCTVTAIWLRTAIQASSLDARRRSFLLCTLPPTFLVFTMMLVLASVSLSVTVFTEYPHASHEWVLKMPLSLLQTLLEATTWGAHAVVVLLCIRMTTGCIYVLVPHEDWKQRLSLLCKAVLPMVVSFLAYTIRCVWLIIAFVRPDQRETWMWLITFVWAPTTTVSFVLLYSVRKRDTLSAPVLGYDLSSHHGSDTNNNHLQQPLILRPQPPEEAFRAFSMVRRGEEMDDSFFWSPIGQPVPQMLSQRDGIAGQDLEAGTGIMRDDASILSRDNETSKDAEGRSHTRTLTDTIGRADD